MTGQGDTTQLLTIADAPAAPQRPAAPQLPLMNQGTTFPSELSMSPEATLSPPQMVTHDVHVVEQKASSSGLTKVVAVLILFVVSVNGYLWLETGEMPNLMRILGLGEESPEEGPAPTKKIAVKSQPTAVEQGLPAPAAVQTNNQVTNIWDKIQNEIGTDLAERSVTLTVDEEASFRDRLGHQYNYQRYKAVVDLSSLHARGSEDLLREALESEKFWTRMRALIGIADLGEEVTGDDVKLALGNAHSELRARFFKRFESSPCSPGCFFVARASLPYLDPLGRAQAIRVIAREASAVRELFLVAATYDQSDVVRSAAGEMLEHIYVDPSIYRDVRKIAEPNLPLTGH